MEQMPKGESDGMKLTLKGLIKTLLPNNLEEKGNKKSNIRQKCNGGVVWWSASTAMR